MDFGLEPPEITTLFKSDFGRESDTWYQSLADRIAQVQGAKPPASQQPTGVSDSVPKLSPLQQRVAQAKTQRDVVSQAKAHPAVQAASQRLSNQGVQVEDKMPDNYSAEQRARAIHNVASGVEFMHRQFPGMDDLARKHNMKYTLQGPQVMEGGQVMGEYHPPGSSNNRGVSPKIELNGTAEQTLFHEQAHFLDHASAGLAPNEVGTLTTGHPLNKFAESLMRHPVRQQAKLNEDMLAQQSGDPEIRRHFIYKSQADEVFARWFNSHMNYLHQKQHGPEGTAEPYDTEENEEWLPEHHEYFGPKFREILRQHKLTRSFAEYLDRLAKAGEGVGSWTGSGEFHSDPVKPVQPTAPSPQPAPTTPSPITPDVPEHVGEATGKLHDDLAQEYAGRSDAWSGLGDKEDAHHAIATHMMANNPLSLEDHIQARIAMRPGSSYKRLHEYLSGLSDLDGHKDLLRTFDNHWIGSVNSSEPEHVIANRVNAGRVFGLNSWENKPNYITNLAWKKGMRLADDPHFQKAHSSYLKSMYAHTQNELAKRGLKSVSLIRGVHKITDPDIMQSIRDQYKNGQDLATGHMDANLAPLSSFTLSPKIASDYGGITPQYGQSSATLNMVGHVPASRILSLWNTGYGYGDHHEVVALGGPARMHWATHSYDGDVMHDWLHKKQRGLIKSMNIPTVDIDDSAENLEWLQPPEIKEKYHDKSVTKSFGDYLSKALEETRQGKPLPGTHRAARSPSGYKIPRKITRPGVRGSTLWWYDEKGNVRYGPKPVQKGPQEEKPEYVKNYLESERPWSFVSAHSDDRPPQENDALHVQLGKELQSGGYQVYPSKGYYADASGQLREEPSYLVFGLTTKSAIPLGQKYGQQTVLTHHGLFDLDGHTLAPIRYKRIEMRDLPKDVPQSVILTQPNHVTLVIDTGQAVPFGPSGA